MPLRDLIAFAISGISAGLCLAAVLITKGWWSNEIAFIALTISVAFGFYVDHRRG